MTENDDEEKGPDGPVETGASDEPTVVMPTLRVQSFPDVGITPTGKTALSDRRLQFAVGVLLAMVVALGVWLGAVRSGSSDDSPELITSPTTVMPSSTVVASTSAPDNASTIAPTSSPQPTVPTTTAPVASTTVPVTSTTSAPTTIAPPVVSTPPAPISPIPPLEAIPPIELPQADPYDGWVVLTDSTGQMRVQVPAGWADLVEVGAAGSQTISLRASTDLVAFQTGWMVPGLEVVRTVRPPDEPGGASPADLDALIDDYAFDTALSDRCVEGEALSYNDKRFDGRYRLYERCAAGTNAVVVIAVPVGLDNILMLVVQMIESRDFEALNRARATFDWISLE